MLHYIIYKIAITYLLYKQYTITVLICSGLLKNNNKNKIVYIFISTSLLLKTMSQSN